MAIHTKGSGQPQPQDNQRNEYVADSQADSFAGVGVGIDQNPPHAPREAADASYTGLMNGNPWTFRGTCGSLSPYQTNAAARQIRTALADYLDARNIELPVGIQVDTIVIGQGAEITIPVVLVITRPKDNSDNYVAYHALLISAAIPELPPLDVSDRNYGGQRIEVQRLPCDLYDSALRSAIDKHVRQLYPKAKVILNGDATVLSRDWNHNDQTSVHLILVNSLMSCVQQIQLNNPNFSDLDLSVAQWDTYRLEARIGMDEATSRDLAGEYERTDVIIRLNSVPVANTQQTSIQSPEAVAEIGGYIDINYTGEPPQHMAPQYDAYGRPIEVLPRMFAPTFVITRLTNYAVQTMPAVWFSILHAAWLAENNLWQQALIPQPYNSHRLNMHSLAGLGYEVGFKETPESKPVYDRIIDLDADNFDQVIYQQFVYRHFHPGLAVAIDIPECGASTWTLSTMAMAARGDVRAREYMTQSLNRLTGGLFSDKFREIAGSEQAPYFLANSNRIHLGHYQHTTGGTRDIRDLDYRAILNLAGVRAEGMKDPNTDVRVYTDSLYSNEHWARRLKARWDLITRYLGGGAVFTGYAWRVTINPAVIRALAECVRSLGYYVDAKVNNYVQAPTDRAAAILTANSLLSSNDTAMFAAATQTSQFNGGGMVGGRFQNGGITPNYYNGY